MRTILRVAPAWAKINRATANAILRSEATTLAELRAHLKRATKTAAYSVAVSQASGIEQSPLVLLGAVRNAQAPLIAGIAQAVVNGRQRARNLAHARLDVEIGQAETMAATSLTRPAPVASPHDTSRAQTIAGTFAHEWARAVTVDFSETSPTPTNVAKASLNQDFRLRRIAATENAQAYSAEHAAAVKSLAAHHRHQKLPGLYRRWEAILDKHVCKICRTMDGQLAPIDGHFANAYEPGDVHPFCRCFSTLVGVASEMPKGTGEGLVTKRRAMTSTVYAPATRTPWGGGKGDWGGGGSSDSF